MRAAVMTAFRAPLEVRTMPDPQPGDNDAVVRVEACGVCRSDWHLWQEDWTWVGVGLQLPAVPGHEIGGVVEHVGKQVKRFKPGDRVTIPFHLACGSCHYCWTGRSNICQAYGFVGAHTSGGFGELTPVPNADMNLVALPDNVTPTTAAALGCRYMTSYHGLVDRVRVQPGEWVVVLGIGGVGLAAVQIATALGARVVAVSRSKEKLELASHEGAVATVQAGDKVSDAVREITGGGADVSVDALGIIATTVPGILALRKGGRHVQLGLTGKDDKGLIGMPVDAMVFQELSFHASSGCPHASYPGLLAMVASGALQPERLLEKTIDAGDVNGVLNRMSDYQTTGFNVITSWNA